MTASQNYWAAQWQYTPAQLSSLLIAWTEGEAYEFTSTTFDSDGVPTTAVVKWPDGYAGVYTTVTKNVTFNMVDAFTITHTAGRIVTQALVTRNATGGVTVRPELVVTFT